MNRWKANLCALALALSMSCAVDTALEGEHEAETSRENEHEDEIESRADALRTSALYLTARRDGRRCAHPGCGGSFVRALNLQQLRCADGTQAPECYVSELDLDALGLSEARARELVREQHKVVFVGALRPSSAHRGFAALVAQRAFLGVTDTRAGTTLLTRNTGIVCIKAPCPTHVGALVNRGSRLTLTQLDLSALRASEADLARIDEALAADGALLSGRLSERARAASLSVTQAYLPVDGPRACGSRGLAACPAGEYCQFGQGACGELDHPGSCAPRPEACIDLFKPVCGCDGKTYGNSCQAASAGISVQRDGACEPEPTGEVVCGGIAPRPCPGAGQCVVERACPPGTRDCPVCTDCTGVCACSGAAVTCGPGTFFDDSPRVCACVARKP